MAVPTVRVCLKKLECAQPHDPIIPTPQSEEMKLAHERYSLPGSLQRYSVAETQNPLRCPLGDAWIKFDITMWVGMSVHARVFVSSSARCQTLSSVWGPPIRTSLFLGPKIVIYLYISLFFKFEGRI